MKSTLIKLSLTTIVKSALEGANVTEFKASFRETTSFTVTKNKVLRLGSARTSQDLLKNEGSVVVRLAVIV